MSIGQHAGLATAPAPPAEVVGGSGFALLVALAAASAGLRRVRDPALLRALDEIGDTSGETWLNLLGVPLDAGPPYGAERLVSALRGVDALELRRHLLGRHAWSWCAVAGVDTIEAAAGGDPAAAAALLAHPRYYGGRAGDALATLLPLEPAETRRRIVNAAEAGAAALLDARTSPAIETAAVAAAAELAHGPALETIERLTGGYRYVVEPEAERILLVPHLERGPNLLLAQHRGARLIVFRVRPQPGNEERLLALGRALADPKRVEILALLGRGLGSVAELVRETGLVRSTVHHHLGQLREAGLVVLEGNARAYAYAPRREAVADAAELLGDVIGTNGS